MEFNSVVIEFGPLATLFVLTETGRRPALFLGTSSDRIGSPEGMQAFYATVGKYLPWARSSINATVNYSEWDDEINFPFGAAIEVGGGFVARFMNDGSRSHALLDYFSASIGVSVMYVWFESFGLAINGELRLEKVKAVAQHKNHSYYFCSDKCKVEFLTDPVAYIPAELPRPAPSFVVVDMEGEDVSSDFEEKVTLVDFWATWCKPCVKSMPVIQRLFEKYGDQGFQVMGISIDENDDRVSRINKFVKKHKISYPVYSDAKAVPAWHTYHVKAVPIMFLINRKGEVVAEWKGHVDNEALVQEVTRLIEISSTEH